MSPSPYCAGLLTPFRVPEAEERNATLLGPRTLGIEVTETELAERCGLGNIDPQHGFGGGQGRSAIEAATSWPLPPAGARMVTVRPDADAFGAMALLGLRAADAAIDRSVRARIALVARCDSFAHGDWASWMADRGPLPRPAAPADMTLAPPDYAAMNALAMSSALEPDDKVATFADWLVAGRIPLMAEHARDVMYSDAASAWNDGKVEVECLSPGAPVAVVTSAAPGALWLGYRLAPVVIALSRSSGARKVTIAQFSDDWLDLAVAAADLNRREPGWGGSATILGSPQGVGSTLPRAVIVAFVLAHLRPSATCSSWMIGD